MEIITTKLTDNWGRLIKVFFCGGERGIVVVSIARVKPVEIGERTIGHDGIYFISVLSLGFAQSRGNKRCTYWGGRHKRYMDTELPLIPPRSP